MAFLLAFGGGALLATLTIDLIAPGVDRGHFEYLAIGAMLGGLVKLLDWLVNRRRGYLSDPEDRSGKPMIVLAAVRYAAVPGVRVPVGDSHDGEFRTAGVVQALHARLASPGLLTQLLGCSAECARACRCRVGEGIRGESLV